LVNLAGADVRSEIAHLVSDVLREIRRAKSDAKVSMKAAVARVVVGDSAPRLASLGLIESDLKDAGQIQRVETFLGDNFRVSVTLA
jgi:valyl-tRNA synthetase